MNRAEFINKLRGALNGKVPTTVIEDHVKYYDEYIDSEMAKGMSEEDVLQILGDPRLIAKTIVEANKHAEETGSYDRKPDFEYGGEQSDNRTTELADKIAKWPKWLKTALSVLGVAVFIIIMSSIITTVLPIVVLVFLGIYLYRRLKR